MGCGWRILQLVPSDCTPLYGFELSTDCLEGSCSIQLLEHTPLPSAMSALGAEAGVLIGVFARERGLFHAVVECGCDEGLEPAPAIT